MVFNIRNIFGKCPVTPIQHTPTLMCRNVQFLGRVAESMPEGQRAKTIRQILAANGYEQEIVWRDKTEENEKYGD